MAKPARIVVAVLLTVVVSYLSMMSSQSSPQSVTHSENGITFEWNTIPRAPENAEAIFAVQVSGDLKPGDRVVLRYSKFDQNDQSNLARFGTLYVTPPDSTEHRYEGELPTGAKGDTLYYFWEVRSNAGSLRAASMDDGGRPYTLAYVGEVSGFVLFGHVGLMALSVLFVALAGLHGLDLIRGGTAVRPLATCATISAVLVFAGGYVFGTLFNAAVYGRTWEGIPFGLNVAHNKTQLLFLWLLVLSLIAFRAARKPSDARLPYSAPTIGWFGVLALVGQLVFFVSPHSLSLPPEVVQNSSYTAIGATALVLIVGLVRSRLSTSQQADGKGRKRRKRASSGD